MSSKLLLTAGVLALVIADVQGDCYSRDGVAATESRYYTGPELVACGRGSNTCCTPGQKCGSNLLCSQGPKLTREYCANKDWQGCSALGAEILPYGITVNECGANLVCYNSTSCCTNGGPIHYVNPATGEVKDAMAQNGDTVPVTWWDIGSSSTSSMVQESATARPISQSTPPTGVSTPVVGTVSSPTSSPTTSASANPDAADTDGLSTGASVGVGIGCAAAVAGLATLGGLWYRRRRASRVVPSYPELGNNLQHQGGIKQGPQTTIYQMDQPESPPQELDHAPKVQELP
ncbi:hypothetical protein BDU57DRAFT_511284 [Ampelomyces quisqualis]|uniref:Mid2 domain-containing protein n=1 Tax=Ampelomyces quisqualis TaxID=50730 RepID=A0A6A5R516_AMPQU|nr:hypothetical protein BDU57DRAFT_511284 [Ampelomyces quisqualis]